MKHFLLVNNIPTPYRTFMYENMWRVAKEHDIEMQVAFLARREARRSWDPDELDMKFPYFYSRVGNGKLHELFSRKVLGLDILKMAAAGKYDFIMAAPAQSLANWLFFSLPGNQRTFRVLYSELNAISARRHYGWRKRLRNAVYRGCDAMVTPGKMARDFLVGSLPTLGKRPYFTFPNVVDPAIFDRWAARNDKTRRDLRKSYGLPWDLPLLVGIGAAKCKGGLSLIPALKSLKRPCRIVILGGDDFREQLLRARAEAGVEAILDLPGVVEPRTVADYLTMADGFVHPAHHDCSPLCCVEAAFNGLPLLLSTQTGNHCELLEPGVNGWLFDGKNQNEIAAVLNDFLNAPLAYWRKMGEHSHQVAGRRFDVVKLSHSFFEWLNHVESGQKDRN